MIIDASNLIVGRMASIAAKKALIGEEVIVVNCEKAIMTGKKNEIIKRYHMRKELGQPTQGPFFPKRPDMFVRRIIRGMVPRKRSRGREAFAKVKCFIGVPASMDSSKFETLENANISKTSTHYFITIKELCRLIGK